MHGQGVYMGAAGRKYEGYYLNDKKHGFGIYKWPDRQALNKLSNTYAIRAPTYFYAWHASSLAISCLLQECWDCLTNWGPTKANVEMETRLRLNHNLD